MKTAGQERLPGLNDFEPYTDGSPEAVGILWGAFCEWLDHIARNGKGVEQMANHELPQPGDSEAPWGMGAVTDELDHGDTAHYEPEQVTVGFSVAKDLGFHHFNKTDTGGFVDKPRIPDSG